MEQAISQNLRNQQDDGIRSLYKYAQILIGLAVNSSKYATNGTDSEFWSLWREKFKPNTNEENDYIEKLNTLKNTPLSAEQKIVYSQNHSIMLVIILKNKKKKNFKSQIKMKLFIICVE